MEEAAKPSCEFPPTLERYRHGDGGERRTDLQVLDLAVAGIAAQLDVMRAALLSVTADHGVCASASAVAEGAADVLFDVSFALESLEDRGRLENH